jgi:hypothetical protein
LHPSFLWHSGRSKREDSVMMLLTSIWETISNEECITLLPCHLHFKSILRQTKKNYRNSNISPSKNIIFKNSSKRNQKPSRYYNSVTNLKFQHKLKISSFRNPHIKLDLLPRGPKSLKLLYSIMNLNTTSLPCLVGKANKEYLVYPPHSRVQQACRTKIHFISTLWRW